MSDRLRGVAIRLHGPLQAWGGPVIGDARPTLPFPTRSGVLGVVAACMGIPRSAHEALRALADGTRVHVRVDSPGTPLVDDQTIQGHPEASDTRQTIQSKRTYLCDASFAAVVIPGPKVTGGAIAAALEAPVFAPFLGRRSCVPSVPLLAAPQVEGGDELALFNEVPPGPSDLLEALSSEEPLDFYLDLDSHPRALRKLPVRDDLVGPLPRQWRERMVCHVRSPAGAPSREVGP